MCGNLGSVYTSLTLGYAPGELSTGIFTTDGNIVYYPFNFADARCPPTSIQNSVSLLGQSGYNPIISPPADLTLLDPNWNANCYAAPFQGNDPPYSLVPAANLVPSPTGLDPVVYPTPASPSPTPSALPVQTHSPSSSPVVFNPQSATVMSVDVATPSAAPNDPGSPAVNTLPSSPSSPPAVSSNPAYNLDPSSNVAIGSETAQTGSPVTIVSTPTSSALSNSYIVVGSSSIAVALQTPALKVFTFAGQTYTANSASAFVINSQTLDPGSAVTISGKAVSLPPSATYVLIGSSELPFLTETPPPTILTFAGHTYSANSASDFAIGGQVLTPGGAITISGIPVSLPTSSGVAIIAGSTVPLITPGAAAEGLTFADQTFTANSASDFVIDGQTLTPGGVITVSGTRISLAQTDVVVGTSTEGLATFILNGFGNPALTTGPIVVPFQGGARKARGGEALVLVGALVAVLIGRL